MSNEYSAPVYTSPKGKDDASHVSQILTAVSGRDIERSRSGAESTVTREGEGALKVRFSLWSMLLFCFTITSTPAAWAGTVSTALYSGGPVTMFFGFLIVWVGSLAGAASLGELCSMWPSADGQISWTSHLAPKSCRRFARYYVAWLTCVAWIFMTSSAAFICSVAIVGVTSFCNISYIPQAWHFVLLFWAVMLLAFCFNVGLFKLFGHLNSLNTTIAVLITFVVVGVVLGMHNGEYNSAKFAFTNFVNGTGWENKSIVFILGMVGASFSILGYDSVTHMAEEIHEPEKNAPKAMVVSVLMSLPTGLLIILSVLFTVSDLESLSQQVFPFLGVLYDATGSTGGSVAILFFLSIFSAAAATISMLATSGRVIWAFALEGGIPFSKWFSHISPRFGVPVRALAISAVVQCLLVLIYLGNSALFNSIIQLAIALLNSSYAIPIALMLFRGRPSGQLKPGPFSLGPVLGPIANIVALSYEIFISFFLFFPNVRPVTGSNMNYACAIVGVAHVLAGIYWFCGGKAKVARHHEESTVSEEEKQG